MTPTDTVRQLTRGGASLAQRPIAVAAYAAGVFSGTIRGALHVAGTIVDGLIHAPGEAQALDEHSFEVPPTRSVEAEPSKGATADGGEGVGERSRYGGLNTEAAPPMSPGGGGESFEHEPTAESRDVAHGDAATQPREVDSWAEETEPAPEDELGEDTDPLLDPGTAKALRSESEMLRRAADPDKG